MIRLALIILSLFWVPLAAESGKSKQVIDLGVLEVQGKLRGPEIQLIESNQMGGEALKKTSRTELKKLEQALLKPMSQPFRTGAASP